ncbi:MAG: IS21 family transposase [Halothiobacillaceae bacterium]|jgi:transposase|nr:IS21 family transposase [Halothiobacillaceae bacterium]
MDQWIELRRQIRNEHVSLRQLERETGIHRQTLRKIRDHSQPPGYHRSRPAEKTKIGPYLGRIQSIIEADKAVHKKQRHTAKKIWEILQSEGFEGGYTIVKDAVRQIQKTSREVFMPLSQHPGEAQVDFGQAVVKFNGTLKKVMFFVMSMVHSDAMFVMAFPRECTEAFMEAHVRAFDFFGCVPNRISYDNTRIAVTKILTHHKRSHTAAFKRLISHYLFESHFCNVRRPNEKGIVEGSVKYARLNFMVPVPQVSDYDALNRLLRDGCHSDLDRILRGKRSLTKRQLLLEDRMASMALPDDTFDYRKSASTFASSESLVRYDTNDYSVPVRSAHHQTTIKASVRFIEVYQQDRLIAKHRRCWDRERQIFDPMHYLELLERKPGSLDYARPLEDWPLPDCFNTYRRCLEAHHDHGTKEYIRILLLLNTYSMTQIAKAIGKALNYRIYGYDAIRQFLLSTEEYALTTFSLAGREHLRRIVVTKTEPAAYSSLVSGGHHVKRA